MAPKDPHLTYRPEIDGLRAVAILSVVLYHAGLSGLPGGFTGVDVFFVISGYLIGGLLWQELQATDRIRLGRFYVRRIRRLAPAYFAMLAATALVAWFVVLPFEFREFGKEVIAATVWLSNVLFWRSAGYFDTAAEEKLLLHTWSLSVEEQFYLVLPLALWVMFRWRRAVVPVLVGLWALSLAASVAMTPDRPVAAFFLFPFRAWELLTGVLLAILWRGRGHWALGALGLALILAGVLLIRPEGFPGAQALIPVAGAALVIAGAQGGGPVNRLLAAPPMVFVGLISYSLYLWHWPVLVLARSWRGGFTGLGEGLAWLALAFCLATLSWRFVERPFRRPGRIGTPMVLGGALTAGVAALGFGALLFQRDGLPGRFAPEVTVHIAASQDFLQDWSRCIRPTEGPWAGVETCAIGPDGPPQVIIWGDSHLRALMDGLAEAATAPGLIIWHAGCPPLFGLTKQENSATPAQDAACTAANAVMRAALTGPEAPETLLIVGRWTYYATGTGIGRDAGNTITLAGDGLTAPDQGTLYAAAWDTTVATLAPHIPRIFVFRQPPELPDYDSRQIARTLAHGRMDAAEALAAGTVAPSDLATRIGPAEAPIRALADAGHITLIDPWPRLCSPDCQAVQDGEGWYFDTNHLTNRGALALRDLFPPVFANAD